MGLKISWTKLHLRFALGAVFLLVAVFVARVNLTKDFFPHPYLFCDEEIYLSESLRMMENSDLLPQVFLGGPVNFFLPTFLTLIGLELDASSLLEVGRLFYSVFLPTIATAVLLLAVLVETKEKSLSLATSTFYGFSPLFLPVGLYWYPDSFIAVFTSLLLLCLSAERSGLISEKVSSLLLGIVCALGIATKATFLLITAMLVLFRLYSRHQVDVPNSNNTHLATFSKTLFIALAILFFPAVDRNLLFVRGQFTNVAVYQNGNRNIIEGLEYYGSHMLIAVFLLIILALPGIIGVLRENALVTWSFLVVSIYVGIWALQAQYLVRNLNLIGPLVCFIAAMAIYRSRGLLKSRYIPLTLALSLTQAVYVGLPVVSDNSSEDPRIAVASKFSGRTQLVGTARQCSLIEESPYVRTIEDTQMKDELQIYIFTSIDDNLLFTGSDKLSWTNPVLTGVEFVRPAKGVMADYLDLDTQTRGFFWPSYKSEVFPGRHLDLIYLERKD